MKQVGKAIPHESAHLHVTGEALYSDDLVLRYPNLLHAWPVQAPHAHARILNLDYSQALNVSGVIKVLTASDVPGINDSFIKNDEPIFPNEVMYHSQAVCWVLAESEEAARLGAEKVKVEYEVLPAILNIKDAIGAGSFQGATLKATRGNIEEAFKTAPRILEGELEVGGQEHFYLETHASLAYLDEAGSVFVHSSTQHPTETQSIVSYVLNIPKNQVIVQCIRMGGGFGGKESQANPFACIAALGAKLTGRPTRVRLNRTQDMTLSGKRHPFYAGFKVGFDGSGKLLAVQTKLFSDGGWSQDLSEPVMARAVCHSDNAYFIPNIEVEGKICKTHKTSQTAFRGFGGPQGIIFIEEIMDRVARSLNLPADEVRQKNFYQEGQSTHYGQEVKDAPRMERIWNELKASSDYTKRKQEIKSFNDQNKCIKRGLAITPVKFGVSFNLTAFNQAGALVLIYQDGSVQINHGGTEMGQGLYTKMQQIAAQSLGVKLEQIRPMPTRTDKIPNTSATAASTGADLNGGAVRDACEKLKGRLSVVAAQEFGVNAQDIIFEDALVWSIWNPEKTLNFKEIVKKAYAQRVQLFADGFYRTPNLHWDISRMQGKPFHYFAYGASVSEVEVDGFTGQYKMLRVDILHDVGDSLSPIVDKGQVEGAFIQGMGWLTLEELRWDKEGRLATKGASTYKLPSFSELPEVFNTNLLEKAAEPDVIYGSKAVGEPPLMLAFSVREALRDAVAAFGNKEVVHLASPATPEAVYWAIESVCKE